MPSTRIRIAVDRPVRRDGTHVLYWCTAQRRTRRNFALQRAAEHAEDLGRPLVVFEPLRVGYPYASDRLHAFVLAGMASNRATYAGRRVRYVPWVERVPGEGAGLLAALAARACIVVADESPVFFLPRLLDAGAAACASVDARLEAVDGVGLLPLAGARAHPSAYAFRRHVQSRARAEFASFPVADPTADLALPEHGGFAAALERRLTPPDDALLRGDPRALAALPIDHSIAPCAQVGGERAALARVDAFLADSLARYADERSHPDAAVESGLSPYLHFGHVGTHEVLARLAAHERWDPGRIAARRDGKREGFWGMSRGAEAFVDQLVTWRELGHHHAAARPDTYATFADQPEWARRTLAAHADDAREHVYARDELAAARTSDALWNAAQRQLLVEGRIQNYMRMLWGKRVLAWTEGPEHAFDLLLELNDRHALDGRDPNSVSGVGWVLGRYDRPWGPERAVYGTVRYMTSASARKKLDLARYLERFGDPTERGSRLG